MRLQAPGPASFLYVDPLAGGVLVNTPGPCSPEAVAVIGAVAPVRFIFLPSGTGAFDLAAWRAATGARTLAGVAEPVDGPVDERLDGSVRITGRLDFLALGGATIGTCAMRSRIPPEIVFFGPALAQAGGWPAFAARAGDWSWENRVIGALGIAGLDFEYAFCDDHVEGISLAGPGASAHVAASISAVAG